VKEKRRGLHEAVGLSKKDGRTRGEEKKKAKAKYIFTKRKVAGLTSAKDYRESRAPGSVSKDVQEKEKRRNHQGGTSAKRRESGKEDIVVDPGPDGG